MQHHHNLIVDKLEKAWKWQADANSTFHDLKTLLVQEIQRSPQDLAVYLSGIVAAASESGLAQRLNEQYSKFIRETFNQIPNAPPPKKRPISASIVYRNTLITSDEFKTSKDRHIHAVSVPGASELINAFDSFEDAVVCLKLYKTVDQLLHSDDFRLAPRDVEYSEPIKVFDPPRVTDEDRAYPRCPIAESKPASFAELFEDADFKGESLSIYPGFGFRDLTKETRHQFLFWETSDWNDSISSIRTGDGTLILFEHINWTGSSISFYGSEPKAKTVSLRCRTWEDSKALWQQIPVHYKRDFFSEVRNLTSLGWNDRVSSVLHGSYF